MRRFARLSLWAFGAVVVLAAALAIYLRNADLSVYEDEIEGYLSAKIGHRLEIDGRFELQVRGLTKLIAERVTLSNPDWASKDPILSVGRLSVFVDLWSLVSGPVIIEDLAIHDIVVYLERDTEGQANWLTGKPPKPESGKFDTELVAFRDVKINSVRASYVDPNRPRPINVSIEYFNVSPDENDVLDLDLQGTVNEFPLWADGKLGPWQNLLDGKDLTADFDATLGQVQLSFAGSADDTRALEGVEANVSLSGPAIDRVANRLGFPPFAAGPFRVEGQLRKLDAGNQVRLEGDLGEIRILASGSVDRLLRPRATQYDFNLSGPDARYVAEVFGVSGLPNIPFQISGDLKRDDRRITLKRTRATLGDNSVTVDGWYEAAGQEPDVDITINAAGPNFAVLAPFVGIDGMPAERFDIDGRIEKSGTRWRFSNVEAVVGENRVAANGSIDRGEDTEIGFSATGPDISFLQPMTGLQGLPQRPYEVSARVKSARDGVRVEEATGLFGDNRVTISGIFGTSPSMAGTRLDVRASGQELHNIALLTGVPHLPDGPFEFGASIALDPDRLSFTNAVATAGELRASAAGTVGLGDDSGDFDVVATVGGPNAARLAEFEFLQEFEGEAISVRGHISRRRDRGELEFEETHLRVGDIEGRADGTLSLEPRSNDSDLKFTVAGPDIGRLGRAVDIDILPAKSFSIGGQFRGTPSGFAMRDFAAQVGGTDINGTFDVDLRGKPRLTAALSSAFLDLSERIPLDELQTEERVAATEQALLMPTEPIDTAALQAANVDLDLRIDRLVANALDVTDFNVGISLQDGKLLVDPIAYAESSGKVDGRILLTPNGATYKLDTAVDLSNVHIGIVGVRGQDRSTLPPITGRVELQGEGRSIHELLANADGAVSLRQGRGRVRDLGTERYLGDLLLNIIRALNPKREKQEYRELDCGIYDIDIVEGLATLRNFTLQTSTMTVVGGGKIDFETEKLDIVIRAKPREGLGISVGSAVNSFLKLGGTLRNPKLQVDPKGTIVSGGAAVMTGGLSLLAKGLFDRVSGAADICKQSADKDENQASDR